MSCLVPALQAFAPAVHVQMPYEAARAACLGPDQAQCKVCDIAGRVQDLTFLKAHTHLSPTVASPHELSRHAVHVQSPPEGELEELPSPVSSLSSRVLDAQGVYLMENGVTSILHFGPEVPSVMVEALLGEWLATFCHCGLHRSRTQSSDPEIRGQQSKGSGPAPAISAWL